MAEEKQEGQVFNPEGISRLLSEDGGKDLNNDERALLLALIGAETASGRELSEEEHAALDKLKTQVEGYDADDLAQAVRKMVTAKPRDSRKLKWPKMKFPKLTKE
ncbi:MAG: hypothetical protein GY832_28065 [Chloroflexi bacterium]|nr:hypothetical protein [Chloroflexota bacterium]